MIHKKDKWTENLTEIGNFQKESTLCNLKSCRIEYNHLQKAVVKS